MAGSTGHRVDVVRQLVVLVVLTVMVITLHWFGMPPEDFDTSGLLALGFVIYAGYTVGALAEVVKLPHITGYLLLGLLLGPSAAEVLHELAPQIHLPAPFDKGLINKEVKKQLVSMDELALALIALTAGGELRLEQLRKGLKTILGIAIGQIVALLLGITGLVWLISGPIPAIALPQLEGLPVAGALALGGVIASISLATSPAATIAVINGTGAKGPNTSTILSVVVLKDVVVVVCFSAATAVATGILVESGGDGGFVESLQHIAGSIGVGSLLGVGIVGYLYWVGAGTFFDLALVFLIYAATLVSHNWHLEPALVFILAGFVTANLSPLQGETLIHRVERLSMPVYVVFFTLAGAKLHLDVLWGMLGFALALVLTRIVMVYLGTYLGAVAGGGGAKLKRYGWMGFVSQAGLAITLASQVQNTYPDGVGQGLFSLLLGAIAINEMIGPVMLQWGLGFTGETANAAASQEEELPVERTDESFLETDQAWGTPLQSQSPELNERVAALEVLLKEVAEELRTGPLMDARADGQAFLTDLRRDYLHGHRRLLVEVQNERLMLEVPDLFRQELANLGSAWRERVLDRAATAKTRRWSPLTLVQVLDDRVAELPEVHRVPVEPSTFEPREEGVVLRLRRLLARMWSRAFQSRREVNLRSLARYHLSGRGPTRLEAVAAVMVHAESALASRTMELFESISRAWSHAADLVESGEVTHAELQEKLLAHRGDVDEDFEAAVQEVVAAFQEGSHRGTAVLGRLSRDLKADVLVAGTLDLPHRARRYGRVYADRNRGLRALGSELEQARHGVSARLAAVALDLELVGLEGRVHGAVEAWAHRLEQDVEQRGAAQLRQVDALLTEWLEYMGATIEAADVDANELVVGVRTRGEALSNQLSEAIRQSQVLRHEMASDEAVGPLVRELLEAAHGLTDRYTVPDGPTVDADWRLPPPQGTTDMHFREVAVSWIEGRVTRDLAELTRSLTEHAQALEVMLLQVDRVLAFNSELAVSELELMASEGRVGPEALVPVHEMLVGAPGRARTRMQRLAAESEQWADEALQGVRHAVLDALEDLRGHVIEGSVGELQLLLNEGAIGRTLSVGAEEWSSLVEGFGGQLEDLLLSSLGPERVLALRRVLGLPIPAEPQALQRALLPPSAKVTLPVVYRRLFSEQALQAGDLVIGREAEVEAGLRALRAGPQRIVVVAGLRGSGTAAVSGAICRVWDGPVRSIELDKPTTEAEVEAWFVDADPETLTTINGIRWLFTPQPGGSRPLRRLAEMWLHHGGELPFLVTADAEVWRHASRLAPMRESISVLLELGPLEVGDLTRAILARHQMSGYDLRFEAGDDLLLKAWRFVYRRRDSDTRRSIAWFRTLHQASGGVLHDALRLWMASISRVDQESGILEIGSVPWPPVSRIATLEDKNLLVLLQVVRQGWVDPDALAHLFQISAVESEAQLVRLRHLGLLNSDSVGRFVVSRHLRGAVQRALQLRGWLQ